MKRKSSSSNRLFALEQSLQNRCQAELKELKQPQGRAKEDKDQTTVKAMAFDFDEAIELSYSEGYYAAAQSNFAEEQSWVTAMGSASTAYEVESFETDASPPPVSANTPSNHGIALPDAARSSVDSGNHAEPQPVQATVVPDTAPQPYKSAQPSAENPDYAKAASHEDDLWSDNEDAQAFAADIQAILRGEKIYDPNQQQTIDTSAAAQPTPESTSPQSAPSQPSPPASETTPPAQSHAIFDQIAKNKAYAQSYDLGDVSMEQRFDAFDQMLDGIERNSQPQLKANSIHESGAFSTPVLEQSEFHAQQLGQVSSALVIEDGIEDNPSQAPIYDQAFIGSGSSIAYYLNALGDLDAFQPLNPPSKELLPAGNHILIGEPDPWQPSLHVRSRGPGYINHQLHLIAQWGDTVPEYSIRYLEREVFAAQNKQAIKNAGIKNWKKSSVTAILKSPAGHFEISGPGFTYKAKKVIVGMGAGPQKTIDDINEDAKRNPETVKERTITRPNPLPAQIVDLDAFMRQPPEGPKQGRPELTIIVHGPNAGIDAVEEAASRGHKVLWFGSSTPPQLLDGQTLKYGPSVPFQKIEKVKIEEQIPSGTSKALRVTYDIIKGVPNQSVEADFYVLALGQNIYAPGAAGDVIKTIRDGLEPIYDINQIYSDRPYETVLGLQTPGTTKTAGLEIIGAAAFELSGKVNHNYIEKANKSLDEALAESAAAVGALSGEEESVLKSLHQKIAEARADLDKFPFHGAAIAEDVENFFKKEVRENPNRFKQTLTAPPDVQARQKAFRSVAAAAVIFQDLARATTYFLSKTKVEKDKTSGKLEWKRDRNVTDEMKNQVKYAVANVIVPPQLVTVRSAVGAIHSVMPRYAFRGTGVDFTTDNRTVIRFYLDKEYPDLAEEDAQYIIFSIIKHRRSGYHPLGYNEWWVKHWKACLEWWNGSSISSRDVKRDRQEFEETIRELQEALEKRYRHEWRSMNRVIQRFFEDDRIGAEILKVLKKYLSELSIDRRNLLLTAYRDGLQKWIPRETSGRLEGEVEIVLEGVLTPEQGEFVCRIIQSLR